MSEVDIETDIETNNEETENQDDKTQENENQTETQDETTESVSVLEMSDEEFEKVEDAEELGADTEQKQDTEQTEEKAEESTEPEDDWDLERLKQPFKANGTDFTVKNVDEAIRLMQMGVGFSSKNEEYKRGKAVLKALEENDVDLNFAIDLVTGNVDAVKKLLKDKEIDPIDLDLDLEESNEYNPKVYTPPTSQIEFETVVEQLRDTPKFDELMTDLSNQWDEESQVAISSQPDLLQTLAEQKANGIYDQVMVEVNRAKILGQLPNQPLLEAYIATGQRMANEGLIKDPSASPQQEPKANNQNNQLNAISQSSKQKRKAASIPKQSQPNDDTNDAINPLELSDEEFEKRYGHLMQ